MLTAAQCRVEAYLTDGGIVCRDCGDKMIEEWLKENGIEHEAVYAKHLAQYVKEHGGEPDLWNRDRLYDRAQDEMEQAAMDALDMRPVIEYELESDWGECGCDCDDCGATLVEPYVDEDEDIDHDEDEDDETGEAL